MAEPGARRRRSSAGPDRSAATRRALVAAAVEVLRTDGFGGATARAIADRAGCNQALIFYHFGTVQDLLVAGLDEVSTSRRRRYGDAMSRARSPAELVDVAAAIFREDLEAGHVAVLVGMIAGASSNPGLGARVAERIAPWRQLAADALGGVLGQGPAASLLPVEEAAHAVVALYLGLEMLASLDGDRGPAVALFERARSIATVLAAGGGLPAAPSRREQA